ncbi:MAG: hypothetical protein ACK5JT_10775 [Hyphomicrobiaceae bacterium]
MGLLLSLFVWTAAIALPLFIVAGYYAGNRALLALAVIVPAWIGVRTYFSCDPELGCGSPGDGVMLIFWAPVILAWLIVAGVAYVILRHRQKTRK